jgi:hypothetical protein|tara:strand:- start:98 stop:499 length:402 start_codon:yes stop_codon:yes gene_type:complete
MTKEKERLLDYYGKSITLSELEKIMVLQSSKSQEEYERKYHKDYGDGSDQREFRRMLIVKEILEAGIESVVVGNGSVFIHHNDRTFRFNLLKGKWSAQNNPDRKTTLSWKNCKKYQSISPSNFVKKYIKEEIV